MHQRPDRLPDQLSSVDLGIDANIPEHYVSDVTTRLSIYRMVASVTTESGVEALKAEFEDRFGSLPPQVQNLLYMVRLRVLATRVKARSVIREGEEIVVRLRGKIGGVRERLQVNLGREVFVGNAQIRLDLKKVCGRWECALVNMLDKLADFIVQIEVDLGYRERNDEDGL